MKEGEAVQAGQVLIRMDSVLAGADVEGDPGRARQQAPGAAPDRRAARRTAVLQEQGRPGRARAAGRGAISRPTYAPTRTRSRRSARSSRRRATTSPRAEGTKAKLEQVLPHYVEQEQAFEKLTKDGFAGRILYTDKRRERIEKEQDLRTQESIIAREPGADRAVGKEDRADQRRLPPAAPDRARRDRRAAREADARSWPSFPTGRSCSSCARRRRASSRTSPRTPRAPWRRPGRS